MILSIVATALIALLAMAPGWLLIRGRANAPGAASAAMAASLTVVMAATALVGIAVFATLGVLLPTLAIVPAAVVSCIAAYWMRHKGDALRTDIEWQGLLLGALFLAFGLFVQWIAVVPGENGALLVHGWYNADWFKHLGHVSAIGNHGLPAADNFNQGELLHYYWLSYVLPGAGQAVGNNSWAALATTNCIFIMLFGSVFYGVIRKVGIGKSIAFVIGLLAIYVSAPIAVPYHLLFGVGIEGIVNLPTAPKAPALITLPMYIPQHLLTIIVLLGWYLLKEHKPLNWLALAALAPAMTISVLLGACVLIAYGLYRLWEGKARAIPELAVMVALSGLFVVVLQVVQLGNIDSAIESPLLVNERPDYPLLQRTILSIVLMVGNVGIPFLIALLGLFYWRPTENENKRTKAFVIALFLAAPIAAFGAEAFLTERLAIETQIRAVNLLGIGNAIIGAMLFQLAWNAGGQRKLVGIAVLVAVSLIAVPSATFRTMWHGRMGDNYTTELARDDRAVLLAMREKTDRRAIVLQYPEPPVLAPVDPGDDAWAAILGQRAVTASLRATDYPKAEPRISSAERFFAGEEEPISDEVDLVYLSRALHPESFDELMQRMEVDERFEQVACYTEACLFQRRDSSRQ